VTFGLAAVSPNEEVVNAAEPRPGERPLDAHVRVPEVAAQYREARLEIEFGAKSQCPPSVAEGTKWSPSHTRRASPRPVPAAITATLAPFCGFPREMTILAEGGTRVQPTAPAARSLMSLTRAIPRSRASLRSSMRPQGKFVTSGHTAEHGTRNTEHRSRDATLGRQRGRVSGSPRAISTCTRKDGFVQDLLAASIVET